MRRWTGLRPSRTSGRARPLMTDMAYLDDAVQADAIFTLLMGEKVEPRKEFIEKEAKTAVNLDY